MINERRKEENMVIRDSSAKWEGTLIDGKGQMRLGSGVYEGAYTSIRFEDDRYQS